jgi:hypothetical protein
LSTTLSDNSGQLTFPEGDNSRLGGAYGLRIDVPDHYVDRASLVDPPDTWPVWTVGWEPLRDSPASDTSVVESWSPDHSVMAAQPAGFITVDRAAARTILHLEEAPSPATLLHPYLASTGVVAGHWMGRAPFHAGVFALGGRAWGVLGGREMGKSSLLMSLHRVGVPILADDVLVIGGDTAFAGPRCLDLRRSAAERFGEGTYIGVVGARERWRVALPAALPQMAFGGWVRLEWADELHVARPRAAVKLRSLLANCGLTAPGIPTPGIIDLLAYPMLELGRPRRWDLADEALDRLLDAITSLPTP